MDRGTRKKTAKKAVPSIVVLAALFFAIIGFTQFVQSKTQEAVDQKYAKEAKEEADLDADGEEEDEYSCMALYGQDFIYRHEFETYLFMGTDASGNEEADGEDYHGGMADFLALLAMDKTDETYGILQLNRDTMADAEVYDGEGKAVTKGLQICTGHWYGSDKEESCLNMANVVSELLGCLEIDGYYALPMEDIPRLNHMVGGVTVKILDDFSQVDPTLKMGETVHLNDQQAYTYIRGRYNVGDEDNISRMERQKQYLGAFAERVEQKMSEDSAFIVEVYQEFQETATTDIPGKRISKLAKKLMDYKYRGIYQFEGKTKLGKQLGDGVEHVEFYPDEDSVVSVMTELYGLEPDTEE